MVACINPTAPTGVSSDDVASRYARFAVCKILWQKLEDAGGCRIEWIFGGIGGKAR